MATFSKKSRILKTDEFSSVFRIRPLKKTDHFSLHCLKKNDEFSIMRFGVVVAKKYVPRSATRVLIKRLCREWFRCLDLQKIEYYKGFDLVLRISAKFDKQIFVSAQSILLKRAIQIELESITECLTSKCKPQTDAMASKLKKDVMSS